MNNYKVIIIFTLATGETMVEFEVMAYYPQEAEDLAFDRFSSMDYNHVGTLSFITEEV